MAVDSSALVHDLRWTTKLCAWRSVLLVGAQLEAAFEILTKWFSLTRLETRTKESNVYASIWV